MDEVKRLKIKETLASTKQRHSLMKCVVREVKLNTRKAPRYAKNDVNTLFREAKWVKNAIVADIDGYNPKDKVVSVKVSDNFEERSLTILSSQMKQSLLTSAHSNLKALHTKKNKGEKVGALKFSSVCNSIPLKQYGNTFQIDFERKRVKIQNIKYWFYAKGLDQLNGEITNAVLVRKPSGLYLHITQFVSKEDDETNPSNSIGIDFGIQHNLTLSNGDTYDISVPESKMVKRYSKRLNRSFKRNGNKKTENHKKRKSQLQRAYEKQNNIKQNHANQIVHEITHKYGFIGIQDEMISNWHKGLFGKQVQQSCMGSIKAKLKNNFKVHVVERSFPSTQLCPICGCLTKHPLKKREYNCIHCGYHHPSRDIKSAQSILDKALEVSMEHRAHSPVELNSDGAPSIIMDGTLRVGATI